ncbi:MAG: SMP-30/gluconolactonase/LRE family protein [Geminicoccaceae bacterium]|nr:SMP-30/gluconolactonase/LRE family protein [Geminicoccaceae bacterium]MDW8125781.1 SMP-30/gluconolactonase/LRE family protein [Geminicoccaceae bacterium]
MNAIRTIASGLLFPEGPVAMPDGSFYVVEIARRTVSRIAPDGTVSVVATPGGGPNGLAIGKDGALYVCNNGGFEFVHEPGHGLRPAWQAHDYVCGRIERVDPRTGAVEVLTRGLPEKKLRGPNDLVVDRTGAIWFTDLGKRRPHDLDWGGIYWLSPDGKEIKEVAYPVLTANGIGLSPDETVLYVAETEGARLWAFDITGPGEVKKHPWPSPHGGRLVYQAGGRAFKRFDSLAVEASGNICVATLATGGISVISPEGELVDFVPMPDAMTTNICFGGPDLRTAYVTLSLSGRLVAIDWPRPGLPLNFLNRRP